MARPQLVRLLLVEDDTDIQKIAKVVLESVGGFTVQICSSGAEMLSQAPAFKPQLILMDMMMPGMNGVEALMALKKNPEISSIPIVFMTAKVQASEIEGYKKLGALDVIRKPFEPMALPGLIRAIWESPAP